MVQTLWRRQRPPTNQATRLFQVHRDTRRSVFFPVLNYFHRWDSASTSTPPHKKLKLKSRTVRDFQEERSNYLQERLEMERERQKKRDEREKERLQLKRENLELKREWMEVNRSLLNATLEHNMLLRKYFEARMSSLTKFHF
ncbi:uncharacterized protein LOC124804713 isoform X2 [Schistocerca piceifrons]|uniref:uncharacterized protein LOC124804713 isoform X2 n=1 Tax=Schistocerca piceifrons TaxID=274613 RepID=UPI001F5FC193|nr:uncharacterized protein LOC124804713 isoform X2 [Schistocerca piceifrons]